MGVLGMMELPEEEVPPERYWHHSERLEEWFKAVRYHRTHPDENSPFAPKDDDDGAPIKSTMRNALVDELMLV